MHRKRAGKPPTLSVQTLPSGRAADNQSASGSVNGSHEADHFTTADKVIAIREYGLLPSLEPVMSPDHAVVWLTFAARRKRYRAGRESHGPLAPSL